MNIVIIAYRPDHTDVCRGCAMGSTESDMQYCVTTDMGEASDFLAYRIKDNDVRDCYEYAEYEINFIINGVDYEGGEEGFDYRILSTLQAEAQKKAANFVKLHEEAEAKKEQAKKDAAAEKTRQQELATIARLQEKHGINK